VGPADLEVAGGVDVDGDLVGFHHSPSTGLKMCSMTSFAELLLALVPVRVVLGGDDDGIDRAGLPFSYSIVTWLLASGRRPGMICLPADLGVPLDEAVAELDRQGHESSVSRQAKPNIMPWSPAPSLSTPRRCLRLLVERD
jgi:hypothetical protein